jgi:hypothetical protein
VRVTVARRVFFGMKDLSEGLLAANMPPTYLPRIVAVYTLAAS